MDHRAHFGRNACWNAGLKGRCLDQVVVVVGGGPGPTIKQLRVHGQVTALPKPQFPHEMKLLTPGLASSGDHCERGQENLWLRVLRTKHDTMGGRAGSHLAFLGATVSGSDTQTECTWISSCDL